MVLVFAYEVWVVEDGEHAGSDVASFPGAMTDTSAQASSSRPGWQSYVCAPHRRQHPVAAIFLFLLAMLLMASGCSTVGPDVPRAPSHAIGDSERTTPLGRAFATEAALNPGLSGFQVLAGGQAAFVTRISLADAAERTLDLQYYSAADDLTTDLLLQRIVSAAQRGVRVRVLVDDIYPPTRHFAHRASAAHPKIEVRLFNPFFWSERWNLARVGELIFDFDRLNRRMHNKLWIADNAAGIVGSRNLGDAYFDALESSNFSDVDLLAVGPIVTEISHSFDAYWNSAAAIVIEAFAARPDAAEGDRVRQSLRMRTAACVEPAPCQWLAQRARDRGPEEIRSTIGDLYWAHAELAYDPPDRDKVAVASGIEHGSIDDRPGGIRTRAELLIVSPYFVLGKDGLRHLDDMHRRGVRVAVLTNSLASTDSLAAHAAYARQRVALLKSGVELFEMRQQPGVGHGGAHLWGRASATSLHAKVVVQDRARALVGSLNQDPRSRLHNTETWLTVHSRALATELAALFDEGIDSHHAFRVELKDVAGVEALAWRTEEHGKAVVYDVEPAAGAWHRFWRAVLGTLIPEDLL